MSATEATNQNRGVPEPRLGFWRRSYAMLVKEFIQLRRDRVSFGMIIMVPLMQLMLFGYAINTTPRDLPTAVLLQESSDIGRSILAALKNTRYFKVTHIASSEAEVDHLLERVSEIAQSCGSTVLRVSTSEEERLKFWAGRKAAFPAVGRIAPDYYCMDGTIPRAKLPLVLARMRELSEQYGLQVANVFHAGDGNLHPLILYDANKADELERAEKFGADILRLCVEVGGVLTGEHGVGVEKRDLMPEMFTEIDLAQQQRLKCAFDSGGLLNPGKVFPTLHRCAELGRVHVHRGKLAFPELPRF